jgi:hypothetical protein
MVKQNGTCRFFRPIGWVASSCTFPLVEGGSIARSHPAIASCGRPTSSRGCPRRRATGLADAFGGVGAGWSGGRAGARSADSARVRLLLRAFPPFEPACLALTKHRLPPPRRPISAAGRKGPVARIPRPPLRRASRHRRESILALGADAFYRLVQYAHQLRHLAQSAFNLAVPALMSSPRVLTPITPVSGGRPPKSIRSMPSCGIDPVAATPTARRVASRPGSHGYR